MNDLSKDSIMHPYILGTNLSFLKILTTNNFWNGLSSDKKGDFTLNGSTLSIKF